MIDRRDGQLLLFVLLAAGISATALVLSGMLASLEHPRAIATGITLDLTLLVPLAYYVLVVRPRGWPAVALAPVILVSLIVAAAILPSDQQHTLRLIEALAVPVEVGLLAWVGWRAAQAIRQMRDDAVVDPVEAIHQSARRLLRMNRAADVLASELAVLHYSIAAWRSRPHGPEGTSAFSTHRRSGHGGLVVGLLVLTAAEGVAVHLLLARWSTTLAWILTFLSLYGALWLVADYRATVLRPLLADRTDVLLRAGLRWRARVPRHQIARVGRRPTEPQACTQSFAFLTQPNLWIEFSAPVLLEGPYGLRRHVRCLGLFVDEPQKFEELLGRQPA